MAVPRGTCGGPAHPSANVSATRGKQASNRREHERTPWVVPLELSLTTRSLGRCSTYTITVETQDISKGGFSFVWRQYLRPGTMVHTQFDHLPNRPRITGVVRSCIHLGAMNHRCGVKFLQIGSSPEDDELDHHEPDPAQ